MYVNGDCLFQLFRLAVEVVEPLVKESKEELKWRFNKEIKEIEKNIDLPQTFCQLSPDPDHRHEEKINQKRTQSLLVPHPVNIGQQTDAVRQEGNNCQEERKNKLADNIETAC